MKRNLVVGLSVIAMSFVLLDLVRRAWSPSLVWIPSVGGSACVVSLFDANRLGITFIQLEDAKLMPLLKKTHQYWADYDNQTGVEMYHNASRRLATLRLSRTTWIIGAPNQYDQPAIELFASLPLWLIGAIGAGYPALLAARSRRRRLIRSSLTPWEEAFRNSGSIRDDLECAECRYNLRGLQPSGNCPECGTAVIESAKIVYHDWVPSLSDRVARAALTTAVLFAWALGRLWIDVRPKDITLGSSQDTVCALD